MSLPREIYKEIGQYLPPSSQSAYHQVNRTFREFPVDLKECCREPSNYEIAKWLWNESLILSDPDNKHYSIFKSFIGLQFIFGNKIIKLLPNGQLVGNKDLNSIEDILEFIGTNKLYLLYPSLSLANNNYNNWLMVRDIFSQRESCKRQNVSSDWCYIQFLSNWIEIMYNGSIYNILRTIGTLTTFITHPTIEKLEIDFSNAFFPSSVVPINQNVPNYSEKYQTFLAQHELDKIDKSIVEKWLKQWFSQLTSKDLAKDPRINYSYTYYM